MAPCNCTASLATNWAPRPILALAIRAISMALSGLRSTLSVASWQAAWASSQHTAISARRCCTTWNLPIGWPNWTRSRVYWVVCSSAPCIAPQASQHWLIRLCAMTRASWVPTVASPSRACDGTLTSSRVRSLARLPSSRRISFWCRPTLSPGTRNRACSAFSRLAETSSVSLLAAPTTWALRPVRR
ncbi:hypothetical protein D9M68_834450 [compost metagenome]